MLTTASLAVVLLLASCTGGGAPADGGTGASTDSADAPTTGASSAVVPPAQAGGPLDLAQVCPATIVMQQDWQPQAEHGAMYALVGGEVEIDSAAKSVSGTLVAQGVDTGVRIEVRPGGPNVGFQSVSDLMYLDDDILVGAVNSDAAIRAAAAGRPVVAVTSQLTRSPQIYLWDPESYPGMTTIAEVAATGATIVTSGEIIPSLLAQQGLVSMDQIDASYEGTPQRFVTDPTIMQQGFGTMEPFVYEHEVAQWMRPVAYQYLHELGYSIYPEPITVRPDVLESEADCLARLVPILQRSQIDYLTEPALTASTNALIVELVETYQTSWTYSAAVAEYSVATQLDAGIVTDDPVSGVFGRFDPDRMAEIVEVFVPVLASHGAVDAGFTIDPGELYTNEFIDASISLGS